METRLIERFAADLMPKDRIAMNSQF